MYEAVIFDCDGVLVDSEIIVIEIERAELAREGLHYEQGAFIAKFNGLPDKAFRAAVNADAAERIGRTLPDAFFEAAHVAKDKALRERLQPVPGAAAMLSALQAPRAVASSTRKVSLGVKLRETGLWPYLGPHAYSAEEVARGKPHPDVFLHASAQIGAEPARCLAIEDSANGVRAAVAAGMRPIGFLGGAHCAPGHGDRLKAAGAVELIATMAELAERFAALELGAPESAPQPEAPPSPQAADR
ncbi:MAG: HAD-IA family hydrolase [Pseudomonadota bacterium]